MDLPPQTHRKQSTHHERNTFKGHFCAALRHDKGDQNHCKNWGDYRQDLDARLVYEHGRRFECPGARELIGIMMRTSNRARYRVGFKRDLVQDLLARDGHVQSMVALTY